MDCRPVAKGNALRKVVTTALMTPFKKAIIAATTPTQFGSGEKAGGSQLVFAAQPMLEANPSFVIIGLDVENAFNEAMRKSILDEIWDTNSLKDIWYYFYRVKQVHSYIGLGGGIKMKGAPFTSSEGEQQGAVEIMPLFTLAVK